MTTSTSANGVIYRVDRPCPLTDDPEMPCAIHEVEHFGQPGTGILMCHSHGEVLGTVTDQGEQVNER